MLSTFFFSITRLIYLLTHVNFFYHPLTESVLYRVHPQYYYIICYAKALPFPAPFPFSPDKLLTCLLCTHSTLKKKRHTPTKYFYNIVKMYIDTFFLKSICSINHPLQEIIIVSYLNSNHKNNCTNYSCDDELLKLKA